MKSRLPQVQITGLKPVGNPFDWLNCAYQHRATARVTPKKCTTCAFSRSHQKGIIRDMLTTRVCAEQSNQVPIPSQKRESGLT